MTQTKFWQKWLLLYFFFSVTLCPQRLCGLFRMGSPGPTPTLTFTQPPSSDSLLYVYSVDTSTSLERKMDALAKSSYICQQTDVGSSLLQLTFLFRRCLWTPSCDFAPENWINEMLKRLTLPPTRMQNQSGGDNVALSVGYPPLPLPHHYHLTHLWRQLSVNQVWTTKQSPGGQIFKCSCFGIVDNHWFDPWEIPEFLGT